MIWRTHLCKVFADVLSSVAQIMTERTGITSLTSTLTKELARNVGRIYDSVVSVGTTFGIQGLAGVVCNMQQPRSEAKRSKATMGGHNVLGGLRGPSKRGVLAIALA